MIKGHREGSDEMDEMEEKDKQAFLAALGINIRNLREARGMTLDELAKKCDYTSENSRSTIQKIEAGKSDIPASKLKKIADALGTTPTELMKASDELQQEMKACELFEECYGKEAYTTVSKFLRLDDYDRGYVNGTIETLLDADKYRKKESKNA